MNHPACIVMTTAGTEDEADALAEAIVEARLAACVQVQRVRSVYRWQGELHREPEWLLMCKTRPVLYAALEALIRERHGYQTPEIVRVPIDAGDPAYLGWLADNTGPLAPGATGGSDGAPQA